MAVGAPANRDILMARRKMEGGRNKKEVGESLSSDLSLIKHTILSTSYWLKLNYMITVIAKEAGKCSILFLSGKMPG